MPVEIAICVNDTGLSLVFLFPKSSVTTVTSPHLTVSKSQIMVSSPQLKSTDFSSRGTPENIQSIIVLPFGDEFRKVSGLICNQEKFGKAVA